MERKTTPLSYWIHLAIGLGFMLRLPAGFNRLRSCQSSDIVSVVYIVFGYAFASVILSHENLYNHEISDKRLLDDCIIETDWDGNITWKWNVNEHFHEIELSEQAKTVLFRNPNYHDNGGGESDWMHINSASYIGPNQWYDAGDERFHPDNIIWSSREANLLAIVSHETGKIVWQLGADFTRTPELRAIGQIIGMHHAHIIPRGLPGEGNLMIFDNGGFAGYGYTSGTSVDGSRSISTCRNLPFSFCQRGNGRFFLVQ